MPQTPDTAATPYCDAATLLQLRDWRTVADLLTDDDTRPAQADLTNTGTTAGANLLKALLAASGDVERWALVGKRYTPADLSAIVGAGGAGAASLQGLVADLAFWRLSKRRWPRQQPQDVSGAEEAQQALRDLREGLLIFGTVEAEDAGLPKPVTPATATPPTDRPPTVVEQAGRYFGSSSRRQCRWG